MVKPGVATLSAGIAASLLLAGCGVATSDAVDPAPEPSTSSPGVQSPATSPKPASAASGNPENLGTKMHSNIVQIRADSDIPAGTQMSFAPGNAYAVTLGQPWDPPQPVSTTDGNLEITFMAGRKRSAMPAQYFLNTAGDDYIAWNPSGHETITQLNFAFNGTITIGTDSYQMVFGQDGSGWSDAYQNWWAIGGASDGWFNLAGQFIVTPDLKYGISADVAGASVFVVYDWANISAEQRQALIKASVKAKQ